MPYKHQLTDQHQTLITCRGVTLPMPTMFVPTMFDGHAFVSYPLILAYWQDFFTAESVRFRFGWRFGLVVTRWPRSTRLRYVRPG